MGSENEIDSVLNAALREYAAQEPPIGIEARVLRHIRTARPAARRVWWSWAVVALTLTGLILATIDKPNGAASRDVVQVRRPPLPDASGAYRGYAAQTLPAVRMAAQTVGRGPRRSPKAPRLVEPAPLSAEERALLQLVRDHPSLASALLADARPVGETESLRIEPLKIDPLE